MIFEDAAGTQPGGVDDVYGAKYVQLRRRVVTVDAAATTLPLVAR